MGVDRVLTSGLQSQAPRGKEMIKYLYDAYGNNIEYKLLLNQYSL